MFDELEIYTSSDYFFFSGDANLASVCNAPRDGAGVYTVYSLKNGRVELVYIGSSGKILKDGNLKCRNGGIYDRIVNNKQFGKPRRHSWKEKIHEENIEALDVYWFKTFDEVHQDLPGTIEGIIMQRYYDVYQKLPRWNKQF